MIRKLNDFFFDVEPDEPIDVMSCIVFYGSCGFIGIIGIVFTIANMLHY